MQKPKSAHAQLVKSPASCSLQQGALWPKRLGLQCPGPARPSRSNSRSQGAAPMQCLNHPLCGVEDTQPLGSFA
eukprot:6160320-Alexandrium_andersonii.AAC.1